MTTPHDSEVNPTDRERGAGIFPGNTNQFVMHPRASLVALECLLAFHSFFFFLDFLKMLIIFKVFIEFFTILLLFYVLVPWPQGTVGS